MIEKETDPKVKPEIGMEKEMNSERLRNLLTIISKYFNV